MDLGTGLAAIGIAGLVEKLLGPTFEYMGHGLLNLAEKRVANVSKIFEKAAKKLGDKIDKPGSVSPRVLKEILSEGSFCDDELMAEYFGGVLASSRSEFSRDDRASTYLKLITELSSYQIRFHFITYITWRNLFISSGLSPTLEKDIEKMWLFFPYSFLKIALNLEESEPYYNILEHCRLGLERHDLIKLSHWGGVDLVNNINKDRKWLEVSEPGICIAPTDFGIDLWFWAIGAGTILPASFFEPNLSLPELPNIQIPPGPKKLVSND